MKTRCFRNLAARRLATFGVATLLACVMTVTAQTPPASPGPTVKQGGKPKIALSATEWNIGEVWFGPVLKYELVVKNDGDGELQIFR